MATLTTQLDQLENAQLVRRLPEEELVYLFKHGLTQESAYESILIKRRREIHRLIAETYERLYAYRLDEFASLFAHHFTAAGNDMKLVEYAIRAGDNEARLSADPEARAHFTLALQALSRLPATPGNRRTQIDTLIKLTAVSFATAGPDQNLGNLRQAESLVEDLLRADAGSPGDRLRLARVRA